MSLSTRSPRSVALAASCYRIALKLLPRRLRRRHAGDLVELFEAIARDAHRRGGLVGLTSAATRGVADLFLRAPLEHRLERTHPVLRFPATERESMFESLKQDLREAARAVWRAPLSSSLIIATLALGMGVNAAMFSVVNAVLINPLGYPDPDRLVVFHGMKEGVATDSGTIAFLNFRDIRGRSRSFSTAAAYDEWRPNLTSDGEPERVEGAQVNVEFFRVLGVEPEVGRFFADGEDRDGDDAVVVLSYGLWSRRYGADPAVVGGTIEVNGRDHQIVGVARRDFEDPLLSGAAWSPPEIWRPFGYEGVALDNLPSRGSSSYTAIGRLADGVSMESARDEVGRLMADLEAAYPDNNPGVGMTLRPLRDRMVGDVRASILLVQSAVLAVLAIASINAGGLLLSRASERRREMAIRAALGAGTLRIGRVLAAEVLLMAAIAGVLGVLGARFLIVALIALGGESVPRTAGVEIDGVVLGFAAAASVLVGMLCALAPLAMLRRAELCDAMRPGGHGTVSDGGARSRRGLVAAQVAVSVVLLVGAMMLGRSLFHLTRVDPGFETSGRLAFDVSLPSRDYPELADKHTFMVTLLRSLEATPGVESAATVNILPLSGSYDCTGFYAVDRPRPEPGQGPCPQVRTVSPSYFETMELRGVSGRLLRDEDTYDSEWVGVINETFAAELWPGEDPIDREIMGYRERAVRVVGVVRGVKHRQLDEPAEPALYLPYAQNIVEWHPSRATVVVHTTAAPRSLIGPVRERVRELDARLPVSGLATLDEVVRESIAAPRYRTVLLGSFAMLAVALAAIGVYGMVSVTVARQRRDLAVRSALGARTSDLRRQVLWNGLAPVLVGVALGLPGALLAGRAMADMLYAVQAFDPFSVAAVIVLLLSIAGASTWSPARRAGRTQPLVALRDE